MSKSSAMTEFLKMTPAELQRELKAKSAEKAARKMGLRLGKEKNSGAYKALKKDVARMNTAMTAMKKQQKVSDSPSKEAKKSVKRSGAKKA